MKVNIVKIVGLTLVLLQGLIFSSIAQYSLPRSTPEAEGISSTGLLEFVNAADTSSTEFHSLMILRNGKVVAEGWWSPYAADIKHTMYSVSKSWTSTAIGFAVTEGLLRVDDKVITFFPEDTPVQLSDALKELTIKHLLTMTVGQDPDPTFNIVSSEENWVRGFLSRTIENPPGSKFLYNSMATYMLSAILQKVTGSTVIDYLKPRLFDPMGIVDYDSEHDPRGINTGGWGMRFQTEAMAKLGQLYLQEGRWNGKQILPASWIRDATNAHILQAPTAAQSVRDSSDWLQGYGYQFWRTRHNAFRADGAFGQFIVVMPDIDVVIVFTAETPDMQRQINLAWKYLLPAIKDTRLPEDKRAQLALRNKLNALKLPLPDKTTPNKTISRNKKTITFEANELMWDELSIQNNAGLLTVNFKVNGEMHPISFKRGEWAFGNTRKHGPYLVSAAKAKFEGLPPFKVAGAYRWRDKNTLELTLRYLESPHTEYITLHLDGVDVTADVVHSFMPANKMTILGKM